MAGVSGRVAFVTGASQGIGRACALALAEAGTEDFGKLTQLLRKAYNWLRHGFSLGFRLWQTHYPGLAMPSIQILSKCKESALESDISGMK